jgi:hypothetical protein
VSLKKSPMKKIASILVFCAFIVVFTISGCTSSSSDKNVEQPAEKALYTCPMDCESGKTYSEKATCPVCGMDLEKADSPV